MTIRRPAVFVLLLAALPTDAEFDTITAYFQVPGDDERFDVIRHRRA